MLIGKAAMTMLTGALALSTSVTAQPTPPPAPITRRVIPTTKMPSVTESRSTSEP